MTVPDPTSRKTALLNELEQTRLLQKKELSMSLSENRRQPPTGLSRLLFRAPIHLFNNGLGWLLGRRFLLLEHTGRKSGKKRQAVVEIMGSDRERNIYLIAAGFGPKSHWYRNILHDPQVHIQVGQRRWAATAVPLSPEAAGTALWEYVQRYPFITKGLSRMIGVTIRGEEAEVRAIAEEGIIPIIRLEPYGQAQLMPLMPGTAVLGAVVSLLILLIYRGRRKHEH